MLIKRKPSSIILTIVIVVSVATLLVYHISELQGRLNELQKLIDDGYKVKITKFSSKNGWMCMGGMTGFIDLNVTLVSFQPDNLAD